jgi:hypothetical protein
VRAFLSVFEFLINIRSASLQLLYRWLWRKAAATLVAAAFAVVSAPVSVTRNAEIGGACPLKRLSVLVLYAPGGSRPPVLGSYFWQIAVTSWSHVRVKSVNVSF